MGKVASKLIKKPFRTFNIDNRAHRVIEKHQMNPKVAPKHPTTKDAIRQVQADNPDWLEAQKVKLEGLNDRLKGMVVRPDKLEEPVTTKSKTLPGNRRQIEDPLYGYLEPEVIRPGRFSIRQALEFISKHQENPTKETVSEIVREYNLDVADAHNVLRYFHAFQIQLPREVIEKLPGATISGRVLLGGIKGSIGPGESKPS